MAQSHRKTTHGIKLCGIFLSSAMALAGCSGAPVIDIPLPAEPNPTHDPTYDTTETRITGEEELVRPVPFSRIQKDGDPRIRRIIARMRMSSVGEEMYQFAVRNNVEFLWESGHEKRKGAYYYHLRRIVIDSHHSDDGVLSTMAHEIRHAWQDSTLNVTGWVLEPADHWRASQLIEADSCAFNAHFVANYKDETGYMLDLKNSFSRSVSRAYTQKPVFDRNYMIDGLEPCLKLTLRPYSTLHMNNLRSYFSRNAVSFNNAATNNATTRTYKMVYRSGFETLDIHQKSALFMRFINNTLDDRTVLPFARNMPAENFLDWVRNRTPFSTKEDEEEVRQMDRDFRKMRQILINAIS